jgi:hypothetical protein
MFLFHIILQVNNHYFKDTSIILVPEMLTTAALEILTTIFLNVLAII